MRNPRPRIYFNRCLNRWVVNPGVFGKWNVQAREFVERLNANNVAISR